MKEVLNGFFEYVEKGEGWSDSFRVVDDDGMSFVLVNLKRFDGRPVRITIEEVPELEARAGEGPEPPMIYRAIGLTADDYRRERQERQKKQNNNG